jgi:hypothetical protein
MSKSCVQIPISESLIVCACKCMFTYVCICLLQCVDRYHTLSEINMPTKASLAGLARLAQARTGGKAVLRGERGEASEPGRIDCLLL